MDNFSSSWFYFSALLAVSAGICQGSRFVVHHSVSRRKDHNKYQLTCIFSSLKCALPRASRMRNTPSPLLPAWLSRCREKSLTIGGENLIVCVYVYMKTTYDSLTSASGFPKVFLINTLNHKTPE